MSKSQVPYRLRDMEVWVDSNTMMGRTTEVVLPNFSANPKVINGSGTPFAYKIPTNEGPLDITLKFSERDPDAIKTYMAPFDKTSFVIRGYTENDIDSGIITINCRGVVMESNFGSLKIDDETEVFTIEVNLSFFEYLNNGVEICYIDNFNRINRWNGVDRMAKRREALLK